MIRIKPQLPGGMRDFLPADMLKRQYVINTVASVFETFGFEPLQTPVLELTETLTGNYGAEAEKLIYHAQHPGQDTQKVAMRYDLTVPLARVFALHESELPLPFKRYQIAPVWRADRPQRGRYREFYQCDVDTVGITGMEADSEIVNVMVTALQKLGFPNFLIKINNRKLLSAIGQYAGLSGEPLNNLYGTIDKIDKIGVAGVEAELLKGNIDSETVKKIMTLLAQVQAENAIGYAAAEARLGALRKTLSEIPIGQEALNELALLFEYLASLGIDGARLAFDPATVRGLSYYTGPIFEATLISDDPEERVGSVSGGGRYDGLIGLFRKNSLPTVGTSLGIERLIYILDKRQMYPPDIAGTVVEVLVTVFDSGSKAASMALAAQLRAAGIRTELYLPEPGKLGKQFAYASKKNIQLAAVLGPDEIANRRVKFKRLSDQTELACALDDATATARSLLAGKKE